MRERGGGRGVGTVRGLLVTVLVAVSLAACGSDGAPDDPPSDVLCLDPSPAGPPARFVVGLEPGSPLTRDGAARARLLGEPALVCVGMGVTGPEIDDVLVLQAERAVTSDEERDVLKVLRAADGVRYAEPDALATPDATPDGPDGGSGSR